MLLALHFGVRNNPLGGLRSNIRPIGRHGFLPDKGKKGA